MTILRVVTLSLGAALVLAACKDTSSAGTDVPAGSQPAVGSGSDTGAAAQQPPGGDVPAGPESTLVECTPDTRKGGMCTREYHPVCGQKTDGTFATYANKCNACSDLAVQRYKDGGCETADGPQ